MKTKNELSAKLEPQAMIVLQLDGNEYLLPAGANIPEILKQLAGIRRLRTDHFFYLEPSVKIVEPGEEVEVGVASWRRVLVNAEQRSTLKTANEEAMNKDVASRKANATA